MRLSLVVFAMITACSQAKSVPDIAVTLPAIESTPDIGESNAELPAANPGSDQAPNEVSKPIAAEKFDQPAPKLDAIPGVEILGPVAIATPTPKAVEIQTCKENQSEQQQHNIVSSLHLVVTTTVYEDMSRKYLVNLRDDAGDYRIKDFEMTAAFKKAELSEPFELKIPINPNSTYAAHLPNGGLVEYIYTLHWQIASSAVPELFNEKPYGLRGTLQPFYYFECKSEAL